MSDTRLNKSVTEPYFDDELPEVLPADPLHWAEAWLAAATERAEQPNPNAMTLSTIDGGGRPSSRVVLCKAFVANPGYVVFYTNYASQKGQEIAGDSRVSCIFHWDHVGRQVRLEGVAVKSPTEESDQYFASRHRGSQLGAWGSDQSRPIESRTALKAQLQQRATEHGSTIQRPPHWGGYRIWPDAVELWLDGADRIHDRARWTRELRQDDDLSFSASAWTGTRLQP